MDFALVQTKLVISKRKKSCLILFALMGVSSFGACRVHYSPSNGERKRLLKLFGAWFSLGENLVNCYEDGARVYHDLKKFFNRESDELVKLKQISKLVNDLKKTFNLIRTEEIQEPMRNIIHAFAAGR